MIDRRGLNSEVVGQFLYGHYPAIVCFHLADDLLLNCHFIYDDDILYTNQILANELTLSSFCRNHKQPLRRECDECDDRCTRLSRALHRARREKLARYADAVGPPKCHPVLCHARARIARNREKLYDDREVRNLQLP
jgi:hypothetical protein